MSGGTIVGIVIQLFASERRDSWEWRAAGPGWRHAGHAATRGAALCAAFEAASLADAREVAPDPAEYCSHCGAQATDAPACCRARRKDLLFNCGTHPVVRP